MFFHRMSQFFPHYDTDYNETFCHVLSNKQKLVNTKLPKIMGDNGDVLKGQQIDSEYYTHR